MSEIPVRRGYYFLVMHLPKPAEITVGALGPISFASGYYIYVGSALNGLEQRVSRHLRHDKAIRWHVDYLLQKASVIDTMLFDTPDNNAEQALREKLIRALNPDNGGRPLETLPTECLLARSVAEQHNASEPAPDFGSSDCRCSTHLFYLGVAADIPGTTIH